ncbi:MAG: serine protein kinase RIO [Thermoplasmatales archaeon]|nr:MAG: serine protein kinase RIO [Thermoplasmatales archaeon]
MSSEFFPDEKWIKKLDRQIRDLSDRVGLDRKTLDKVFDESTLLDLGKLISDRVIEYLDFPISAGKEAIIFRGVTPDKKFVAVKIYRTSTLTFKHISKYIEGDPRFNCTNKTRRGIIFEWAKKEFKNLERLKKVGVRAPGPIKKINNIVLMEYIGDEGRPAPLLKDVELKAPKIIFDELLSFISLMYKKAELVHADFSAYNILMYKEKPYVIDLGQGVILEHPLSLEFLKRDIYNTVQYFSRFGLKEDENEIFKRIVKKN